MAFMTFMADNRSRAKTQMVLENLNIGIVGSNPTLGMVSFLGLCCPM
jgi:hypothetical protein